MSMTSMFGKKEGGKHMNSISIFLLGGGKKNYPLRYAAGDSL